MSAPTTLLLRLAGPMQSWGTHSRFSVRDTGLEPSKSGVVGLLCAALGRPRTAPIADLAVLQMGVRVDREGVMAYDYHTAQQVLRASGSIKPTEVSRRYYLADAVFLVGLQGDEALLPSIHAALRRPVWSLYLGRKSHVSGQPIWLPDGLRRGQDLLTALQSHPWQGRLDHKEPPDRLRLVLDDRDGPEVRPDLPLSFESAARRFAPRRLRTDWIPLEVLPCTSPD